MTMPNRDDAAAVIGSTFWIAILAFWLVLFVVAGTLAFALAIWNLIGAF